MKSALLHLSNRNDEQAFQIVVYDEKFPCLICTLPVESASMGGTAICGACDCGELRKGGKRQYYKAEGREMPSVWSNVKESFLFKTKEEAEQKMFNLHKTGIMGWAHIIRKFTSAANR